MTFNFIENGTTIYTTKAASLSQATGQAMSHAAKHGPYEKDWPTLLAKITDVTCDGVSIRESF